MEINECSGLRQAVILTVFLRESTTADQICTNLVSTSKLKSLLLKVLKTEKVEFMAALQQPLKQRTCFLRHPVNQYSRVPNKRGGGENNRGIGIRNGLI